MADDDVDADKTDSFDGEFDDFDADKADSFAGPEESRDRDTSRMPAPIDARTLASPRSQ